MVAEGTIIRQLPRYLRFRWRLIVLNRRLIGTPWWHDLTTARWPVAASLKVSILAVSVPAFIVALAVLGGSAVGAIWPDILGPQANNPFSQSLAKMWPWQSFAVWASIIYLSVRLIPLISRTTRSCTIRSAMFEASRSLDGTARLRDVWDSGRSHSDFLQSLFAQYKGQLGELQGDNYEITPVIDESQPVHNRLAGAWTLRTSARLTDVIRDADPSTVKSDADARRLDLRGQPDSMPPYAAKHLASSRTRFLAQLKRLRSGTGGAPVLPLTESELGQHVDRSEKGLNYVVRGLVPTNAGTVGITVDRARYGQIMRSCDYLIEEAFIAAGLCAQHPPIKLRGEWLMSALPARREVMRLGARELLNPQRRAAGLGLAAIVATGVEHKDARLLYKKRSYDVGTYPGMYHAVPTGMYNSKSQDTQGTHDQRIHPGRVLLTEFFEELKNAEDLDGFGSDNNWQALLSTHLDWFLRDPTGYHNRAPVSQDRKETSARRLTKLRAEAAESTSTRAHEADQFKVWVTGIALDLLSLRMELCCVIGLPAGPLMENNISLNEEGSGYTWFPNPDSPGIHQLPAADTWVRSGYAAFILAHQAVKHGLDPDAACTPSDFQL